MTSTNQQRPIIMVSSSVYGIEELLNQIFAMLEKYGYTVWMSHKGTMPVSSTGTAFDNCLEAVNQCDAFLGIITGWYGSGVEPREKGITHQEILCAIEQNKLRWFLVHHDVAVARQLLKQFRFNNDGTSKPLDFKRTPVLSDIRVLEMYESAVRQDLPLAQRTGNWVQEYTNFGDALRYVEAQFADAKRIWKLLNRPTS